MPLSLSDRSLRVVLESAALIPQSQRDSFLRSIAGRLADVPKPTLGDVQQAICFVLATRGIAVGKAHFRSKVVA
jgi:hypothetical protein